jgi:hypothetical protein
MQYPDKKRNVPIAVVSLAPCICGQQLSIPDKANVKHTCSCHMCLAQKDDLQGLESEVGPASSWYCTGKACNGQDESQITEDKDMC